MLLTSCSCPVHNHRRGLVGIRDGDSRSRIRVVETVGVSVVQTICKRWLGSTSRNQRIGRVAVGLVVRVAVVGEIRGRAWDYWGQTPSIPSSSIPLSSTVPSTTISSSDRLKRWFVAPDWSLHKTRVVR